MDHIDNYLQWLKENMKQNTIDDSTIEITTPFLDRHNDYTQIYITKLDDDVVRISDWGYIVDDLNMCGVSLEKGRRNMFFRQVLNSRGVQYDEEQKALYIECGDSEIPQSQHALLQTMLDIDDMFYLSTDAVSSVFYDDVIKFFDDNSIYYSESIKVTGRSGLTHDFPFVLQRNKNNPERMVKLCNKLTKNEAERIMFAWSDVSDNRKNSKLLILVNDKNGYNKDLPEHMSKYNGSISTLKWSEIKENIDKLA